MKTENILESAVWGYLNTIRGRNSVASQQLTGMQGSDLHFAFMITTPDNYHLSSGVLPQGTCPSQSLHEMSFIVHGNEDSPVVPVLIYLQRKILGHIQNCNWEGMQFLPQLPENSNL